MRKILFLTAALIGLSSPLVGFNANAAPEPQQQGQNVVSITGTVLDENDEPIIGASVQQKGVPSNGTATNVDGHFTLRVPAGATLQVSFIGYETVEVKASPSMTVYMSPTTQYLDEVVAIGYGTQKRVNLTGAVSTVDVPRVMENRSTGDVAKALQGAVPGLTITTNSGAITSSGAATMKIRGTGTLSNGQSSNPLLIVDGVVVDDLTYINPDDIAEISVLKDAASASIYGTRAAFGVILITTKSANAKDRVSVNYTNNFGWSSATVLPKYSSVPNQLRALMQANNRQGVENELFGMYLDVMLPYAEMWDQAHGGKPYTSYREMKKFSSMTQDGIGDYFVNPDGSGAMYYANWDVAKILFRAAPSQKHNVSLEGQSGRTNYRLSFGYDEREGTIAFNAPEMRRYNVTSNINTQIFDWWKAGLRITFADKVYSGQQAWRSPYTYGWRWGSYFGPYGYIVDEETGEAYDANAAIGYAKYPGTFKDDSKQLRMQAYTDITLFKDLVIHADFAWNTENYNAETAYLPYTVWNTWGGNLSAPSQQVGMSSTYAQETNATSKLWNVNVYGTYTKKFIDKLNLKVMLGGTAEQYSYKTFSARKGVLQDVNLPFLGLTSGDNTTWTISNSRSHRATAGYFGRINLDWDNIWLLEFNGRYDGSSRFPANQQWAFFPSISGGYRFSQENYFEGLRNSWWNNGKLRASWGHIGNEAIGSNMFISTIGSGTLDWLQNGGHLAYGGMPSLVSSRLTWERIVTTDIGLDLGFLNNELNFTFDWFQRDTKDMLAPSQTVPGILGASAPQGNNGSLRTRGWELGINYNHSFGDANVYANFNIYDGKTIVTEYRNDAGLINNFYTGKVYGEIWGFETDRYFEESDFTGKNANGSWIYAPGVADQTKLQSGGFIYGPGDIKFKDLNGDGVIDGGSGTLEDHGDLKVIGNAVPRYEYSFRLGASWKGFDIDAFFQGVGRRQWWSTSAFVMPMTRGADATYANMESYNKMIFDDSNNIIGYEIDQSNDYPCMFAGASTTGTISGLGQGRFNFYPQTKYLMNMAYLRFKTLTVGYTLPIELTRKVWIQKARIYFSADNLCLLYNGMRKYPIDPEIGSTWTTSLSYSDGTFGRTEPMNKTFSFGIQVTL